MNKIAILLVLFSTIIISQDFSYVGNSSCKMCHNKEAKGAQFSKWEVTKHATAFETLKTEKATNIAIENGITTDPWKAPDCVKCHTTGYGNGGYEIKEEQFWNPSAEDKSGQKAVKLMKGLESVGCESCHGAGSAYKSSKTMKSIAAGETKGSTVGLSTITEATCIVCHNEESPTYKPFNFDERVEIISHPMP